MCTSADRRIGFNFEQSADTLCMTCGSIFIHFLKATMTLQDNTKHDTKHDTTTASTEHQHHVQAAEHLELAAKSHKEAAKLISAGDHKGSLQHVETAKTHTAHASEHVKEAHKKSMSAVKAHA
jgi:hypothetical protein